MSFAGIIEMDLRSLANEVKKKGTLFNVGFYAKLPKFVKTLRVELKHYWYCLRNTLIIPYFY